LPTGTEPSHQRWLGRCLEFLLERGLHRRPPGTTPPFAPERVHRILVPHHYEVGDVLCVTPTLRALRRAFPGAHLAILVSEYCRAVVERNPDVNDVLTYTRPKHRPGWFGRLAYGDMLRVTRALLAGRFDLAIVIRRPFSHTNAWLAYASGSPWRLGYLAPASHPFRFFLNLGREAGDAPLHEVDAGLNLVASIGVPAAGRELTLVPDPEVQAAISRRLLQAGDAGGPGRAFVHISSRREHNRWPLPAFAQAADALRDRLGLTVVLSWAPGDAHNPLFPGDDGKAEEVAARMRTRPILLRTPTLAELIAAVSLSDFVLSPDGAVVHIAAALRIPQVALFGRTSEGQWAPVNEKSVLLKGSRADRIPVDEVVSAAVSVVSQWERGRGHETPRGGARGDPAPAGPGGWDAGEG